MKIRFFSILLLITLFQCDTAEKVDLSLYNCTFSTDSSSTNPHLHRYQSLIDDIVGSGMPGIMMSVRTPQYGVWNGAAGMADIHSGVKMKPCNISRAGSVAKTFTAVSILLLVQEGKLSLDERAEKYLPTDIVSNIKNSESATIRQLLNHTSGIYNYIQDLRFQTASLNNLSKEWKQEELLHYAYRKKPYFKPGEGCRYSNTGYILLGMIVEKITGAHFSQDFKEKIFIPLDLTQTSFASTNPVPQNIVRGYIDMYSDFTLSESTFYSGWDYYTADGGLITNPFDLNLFLESVIKGSLLDKERLKEMLTWTEMKKEEESFETSSGLGIFRINTKYGFAYMHSGDAIGYYGVMFYFPDQKVNIAIQCNGNYGKLNELIYTKKAMEQVFEAILGE